jgi:hypothetical protein
VCCSCGGCGVCCSRLQRVCYSSGVRWSNRLARLAAAAAEAAAAASRRTGAAGAAAPAAARGLPAAGGSSRPREGTGGAGASQKEWNGLRGWGGGEGGGGVSGPPPRCRSRADRATPLRAGRPAPPPGPLPRLPHRPNTPVNELVKTIGQTLVKKQLVKTTGQKTWSKQMSNWSPGGLALLAAGVAGPGGEHGAHEGGHARRHERAAAKGG